MHFHDASERKLIIVNLNSPRSNKLSCCNLVFPFFWSFSLSVCLVLSWEEQYSCRYCSQTLQGSSCGMLKFPFTGEKVVGLCQGGWQTWVVLRCCEVNLPRLVSLLTSAGSPWGKSVSHFPKDKALLLPWGGLCILFMLREIACAANKPWAGWWRKVIVCWFGCQAWSEAAGRTQVGASDGNIHTVAQRSFHKFP